VTNGPVFYGALKSPGVLVRFDHVARFHRKRDDLNAAAQQKGKEKSASFSPALVMKQSFSFYELSSHEAAHHHS
jgi:hypothetical protein